MPIISIIGTTALICNLWLETCWFINDLWRILIIIICLLAASISGGMDVLANIVDHMDAWLYCFFKFKQWQKLKTHSDKPQNKDIYCSKFTAFNYKAVLHSTFSSGVCAIHFYMIFFTVSIKCIYRALEQLVLQIYRKPTFSNSSQVILLICMKFCTQHLWTLLTKSY